VRTLLVIGIGAGHPEHLTLQAVGALRRARTVFLLDKGSAAGELAALRRDVIAAHAQQPYDVVEIPDPPRDRAPHDYAAEVHDWHAARAALISTAVAQLPEDAVAAFLVWGDPSLYDSTLRIVDRLDVPCAVEVIPGITAVQALTAAHGTTLNRVGEPVLITTGRRLAADGLGAHDAVVMLDAHDGWRGLDPDVEIVWGACLGTADEVLIRGAVGAVGEQISQARAELRARKGWVMDVYLLRRPAQR
jgi:precorrin-6A synthase